VTREFPGTSFTAPSTETDGVEKTDSFFTLVVDLDNDGAREVLVSNTNREGGLIGVYNEGNKEIIDFGELMSFKTALTPSFHSLLIRDFNKDGISDIIINAGGTVEAGGFFSAGGFIILDGGKIVEFLKDPQKLEDAKARTGRIEEKLRKYFTPTQISSCSQVEPYECKTDIVIDEIGAITHFVENGSAFYDESLEHIRYTSVVDTWNSESRGVYKEDRTVSYDPRKKKIVMKMQGGETRLIDVVWDSQ